MTNDVTRKGWEYREQTDANHRKRRDPRVRRPVERFKRNAPDSARYCHSKSITPHRGPLEVHHVGGRLYPNPQLVFMCRRHNREASGIKGFFRKVSTHQWWGVFRFW